MSAFTLVGADVQIIRVHAAVKNLIETAIFLISLSNREKTWTSIYVWTKDTSF